MPSLRFPVFADIFFTNENGNSTDAIHVASVDLDLERPQIALYTYRRLRNVLNQLVKSESNVVSYSHLYIFDPDYILIDKGIVDVKVVDEEYFITRIPVHPLVKASYEYLLQEFTNGGGVVVELLPSP